MYKILGYIYIGVVGFAIILMVNAKWTFGHISCALLGSSIVAFLAFLYKKPKDEAFFSLKNMSTDPLRSSKTFGEYTHPLLHKTYFIDRK